MVDPTDVPSVDELAAQLRASNQQQAELRRALHEANRRIERMAQRVDQLSGELRTRRLIVVDEAGNERIVAAADNDLAAIEIGGGLSNDARVTVSAATEVGVAGIQLSLGDEAHGAFEVTRTASDGSPLAQLSIGRAGGPMATVQPHMSRLQRPEGATVHLLTTPDDAELYLHSGPAQVTEAAESARATVHVLRGGERERGQASIELAAGGQPVRRLDTE